MVLYVLRGAFVILAASVTFLYVLSFQQEGIAKNFNVSMATVAVMVGIAAGAAGAVVALDMFTREKRMSALSGIFLGLVGGLLVAYALSFVVELIGTLFAPETSPNHEAFLNLLQGVKVFIGLISCYLGISLVMQTKDDFRFVIPYVEFAREIRGNRPTLLDTSVIIDGRILDIVETQIIQGSLMVPKFVLNELQTIADSADKLRRARGRRGLDILQKLQSSDLVDIVIDDTDAEGATVDHKLLALAREIKARVMTNDYNLNKVAALRGVDVVNINDVAKAVRPVVLPGEVMPVKVIKAGEGPGQGVGYLEDGTMVVVENGRSRMGQALDVEVTSTLQTSAGRMIFGRMLRESGTTSALRPGESEHEATEPTHTTPREPVAGGHRGGRNPRRS